MNLTEIALKTNVVLHEENPKWDMWKGSPFETFYLSSSKAKGSKGERMLGEIMEKLGHRVLRDNKGRLRRLQGCSDHDIVINDTPVEVKTSLTWGSDRDKFTWQQIRSRQKYDRIIFMGLNPDDIKVFWATKKDLEENVFGRDGYRQHGGKNGQQELYWIQNEIPAWFRDLKEW